ncbi:MAG: hypothetical protein KTR31_36215 [Myxococcales bacterium]|nr:hypothetical protein [Myxococcales bacterium]
MQSGFLDFFSQALRFDREFVDQLRIDLAVSLCVLIAECTSPTCPQRWRSGWTG